MPQTPEEQRALTGIVIVSETNLTTAGGPKDALYRRLRALNPRAQVGYTIFVYELGGGSL